MGALLDIVEYLKTPLGAILAIAGVAALFFFGRWVLQD